MFGKEFNLAPPILALLILSDKGDRIFVQYSDNASHHVLMLNDEKRREFEVQLVTKARRTTIRLNQVEVISFNDYLALYRCIGDANIIIIGDAHANEIMLLELADAIYEALLGQLGDKICHAYLLKRLDQVILIVDEFIENGYVNGVDHKCVLKRIAMVD